jgi:hypothetical protein
VCNAVEVGRERLRNDRDPHVHKIAHSLSVFCYYSVTIGRTLYDISRPAMEEAPLYGC